MLFLLYDSMAVFSRKSNFAAIIKFLNMMVHLNPVRNLRARRIILKEYNNCKVAFSAQCSL